MNCYIVKTDSKDRSLMKKAMIKFVIVLLVVIVCLNIVAMLGVSIAHSRVFSRCSLKEYDTDYFLTYNDIDTQKYPREELTIPSGGNKLQGFLYNAQSSQGLIIVSPGHRDYSDIKLPEILYFVDKGWMVLCYDYTGCYGSEGKDMVGYTQAPTDLNAVLEFVEDNNRFSNLPILLFGHSLGAYASSAVLQYNPPVQAVVAASGFDDPMEQWGYSVKRSTGIFGGLLSPYAKLLMQLKFGDRAHFSAIDGINSTDIPVLVMQGTTDEYYGDVSSIYKHRDKITNKSCVLRLMDKEDHHGHYDYFLSDAAVAYKQKIKESTVNSESIDKFLYIEHDTKIMDEINQFYLDAIIK